ncbi:MAG TPA: COX aromatic rich motif-containing protein [Candidatus Saccharimonadales bacterium]|nr:COX aromatic rich motif-containing protein [Candidatus Saccharimonadales bacterium]
MKKFRPVWTALLVILGLVALAGGYLHHRTIAVLQPAGEIGTKERNLIIACLLLSTIVVVPVFILLFTIAWRYREGNTRATYTPDQDGSRALETVWWLIPAALLVVISTITWRSSYALDPYKQIDTDRPTLHIQVVAMDWKWLFIYPHENIARVNAVDVPVGTPVEFDITSDTVMTSFWAPALGGQMYAMPGMSTHLNLVADKAGDYSGVAANISGKGFADMKFTVHALPPEAYGDWLRAMHHVPQHLTTAEYNKLTKPGVITQPTEAKHGYSSVQPYLYDTIMMKYMTPDVTSVNQTSQQKLIVPTHTGDSS